jgi:hypothetical protein
MHRDIDGDVWYFAPIDPPEHVRVDLEDQVVLWVNYVSRTVWSLCFELSAHKWPWNNWADMCKEERALAQEIRDVTGEG